MIDQSPPNELNEFRALLGDAGITHTLRSSKGGWPYIRFQTEQLGEVSLQYRKQKRVKTPEGKKIKEAHFLMFIAVDKEIWGGDQTTRSFRSIADLIGFIGLDMRKMDNSRDSRDFSMETRSLPILPPEEEASYLAMMR